MTTIRELIISKRKESRMTQKELSEKTGITQARISEFESGARSMTSDNIDKIIEALDIQFKKNRENEWDFAKKSAQKLKSKGVNKIDSLSREDISNLIESPEILALKEYEEEQYDKLYLKGLIDEHDTFNYLRALISFHLALIK